MTTAGSSPSLPSTGMDAGSAAPTAVEPADGRIVLCERLLSDLRTEITRADNKAAVLVATFSMAAGVFSGHLAGQDWSPDSISSAAAGFRWTGAGSFVLSLLALLMAVLPRYRGGTWRPGMPLTYFGDIRQAARSGLLGAALDDTEHDRAAGLTATLAETSWIATRKHQWIRTGLIAFCIGTVLLSASMVIR